MDRDRRIETLETRLSYQEKTISELSSELFAQSRRIEGLERLLADMAGKVREVSAALEQPAPGDEKPPHW